MKSFSQKSRNLVATAVVGSILAACSGGGADSTANNTLPTKTPTTSNNTTPPVTTPSSVNVGSSTPEGLENLSQKADQILAGQEMMKNDIAENTEAIDDVSSDTNFLKWAAIGALGFLGVNMIYRGIKNAQNAPEGEGVKSFFQGLLFMDKPNHEQALTKEITDANAQEYKTWVTGLDNNNKAAFGEALGTTGEALLMMGDQMDEEAAARQKFGGVVNDAKVATDNNTGAVGGLTTSVTTLGTNVTTLESRLSKIETETVPALEGRIRAEGQARGAAEQRAAAAEQESRRLKARTAAAELEALNVQLDAKLNKDVTDLMALVSKKKPSKDEFAKAETLKTSIKSEFQAAEQKVKSMEQLLAELQSSGLSGSELSSAQNSLTAAKGKLDGLSANKPVADLLGATPAATNP